MVCRRTRRVWSRGFPMTPGRGWIASLDINPLVYGSGGFVAVDALCLLRD